MERPGTLILPDTSELLQPLPRKLHAAWAELNGRKVKLPPTVAVELAPEGYPPTGHDGISAAELRLQSKTDQLTERQERQLQQQAWWALMWRKEGTPYELIELTSSRQELADELERAIDPGCFRNTKPAFIGGHRDTKIVCETLAVGGTILLTSNVRSIDHRRVNDWAIANGDRLEFRAARVVQEADAMLLRSTRKRQKLDKWLQAGLMACWPRNDNAPADKIVKQTIADVRHMTYGRLQGAGIRLVKGLQEHRNREQLVERVRERLPSPTILTDRQHPSYPERPSTTAYHEAPRNLTPGTNRQGPNR